MTPSTSVAEQLSDGMPNASSENIIRISEADLACRKAASADGREVAGFTDMRKLRGRREWREHRDRVHAGDILFCPNYNDDPDPAVRETVEKLVDTSKVIELERIDFEKLPKRRLFRFVKRAFDIAACSAALVVCAIPMAVVAVAVKLDSPGPVFYAQERVGKGGREFTMYKFRSMCVDAEERLEELRELNEKTGPVFKIADDPRITRVGKVIRKLSLDEMPQFLNVLKQQEQDQQQAAQQPQQEAQGALGS